LKYVSTLTFVIPRSRLACGKLRKKMTLQNRHGCEARRAGHQT
jgi:hypothetical protein